nr:T9SS type A sorting domain-containing protein [bacterium]
EGSHQTPLLVIGGAVQDEHGRLLDGIQLHIHNNTTGQEVVQISGKDASSGAYIAMLTDFTHNRAGKVGDIIEIRAVAANGQFRSTTTQLKLTPEHIRLGHLQIPTLRLLSRPQRTALLQNYPNPFNPETWLPYQLAQSEDVTISIFNLQGRLVRQLRLGHQPAGYYLSQSHAAHWDGRNESGERVASGVYMYQLVTQSFQQTRRLVVVK